MRTLSALLAGVVIWNGVATGAVERPPAAELPKAGILFEEPFARLTIHGRLQFIATCLPGETGIWFVEAGGQTLRLSLVNEELIKKAHALGTQPVTIQGFLKNREVIVDALDLDARKDKTPEILVDLQGKLNFPETLRPEDKGLSMWVDGQLFWLDPDEHPELRKQAERLADVTVAAGGRLELRHFGGGTSFVVHLTYVRDATLLAR